MKASDHIKRAAFEKAVDYFLADPEHNIVKIMDLIESYAGVLPFTEKATPEIIFRETGLSKAAFKRAVGRLYKERRIQITDGKIRKNEA